MEFERVSVEGFKAVGISARVEMETAAEKIRGLWERWYAEGVQEQIKHKASDELYNVYTDYEGDHTDPYTCFLGCRVESFVDIPEGCEAREFPGGDYAVIDVRGPLPDVVLKTWMDVYESNLDRRFGVDFDLYGVEAGNPGDARLKTYVSICE